MPPHGRHDSKVRELLALLLLAFALLVSNTAAGLASRLARSLAFATAAVLSAFTQVASFDGLNVFHDGNLHKNYLPHIIAYLAPLVNSLKNIFYAQI